MVDLAWKCHKKGYGGKVCGSVTTGYIVCITDGAWKIATISHHGGGC